MNKKIFLTGILMLLFIYAFNDIQADESDKSEQLMAQYDDIMPPPPPPDFDESHPQRGPKRGMGERRGGPGPGMGPGWFGEHFDENAFGRGKRYEKLRMMKMFEFLELDDTTQAKMLDYMVEQRMKIRSLFQEKNQLIDNLGDMIKSDEYTEQELNDQINKVIQNKEDFLAQMKGMFKKMRSMLTDEQLAKFLIFNERFDQKLFDEIRNMNPRFQKDVIPKESNDN